MRNGRLELRLALAFVLCSVVPGEGFAQGGGLSLRFRQPEMRVRPGAPLVTDVVFDRRGGGLLQGRLVLRFIGVETAREYVSGEYALTSGEKAYRLVLPAMTSSGDDSQVAADVFFRTADGTIPVGRHSFFAPNRDGHSWSVAVGDPTVGGVRERPPSDVARRLRLETFLKLSSQRRSVWGTALVRMDPEAFPTSPMDWCSFDVVLLEADALAATRERALRSLLRWVESGGSVCIAPIRFRGTDDNAPVEPLKGYHVDFLNALSGGNPPGLFGLSPEGTLKPAAPPGEIFKCRLGLGRALVLWPRQDGMTPDLGSSRGRGALAFLWKLRRDVSDRIVAHAGSGGSSPYEHNLDRDFAEEGLDPERRADNIALLLRPLRLRLVPLWVVATVLGALVLLIGPVDYLLLGLLRARRLTWVLFPASAIAAAVVMVGVTEHYIGKLGSRRSMTFVDVGEGGRVLRANRFEMIFPASTGEASVELKDAVFAPLRVLRQEAGWQPFDAESLKVSYDGRFPSGYVATRSVRKWSPVMSRAFTLPPGDESPGPASVAGGPALNWGALEAAGRNGVASILIVAANPTVLNKDEVKTALVGPGDFNGEILLLGVSNRVQIHGRPRVERSEEEGRAATLSAEVQRLSFGARRGLDSVFASVSPTAGDGWEDLRIMDDSDPHILLVVIVQDGDDWLIYRRRYDLPGEK